MAFFLQYVLYLIVLSLMKQFVVEYERVHMIQIMISLYNHDHFISNYKERCSSWDEIREIK